MMHVKLTPGQIYISVRVLVESEAKSRVIVDEKSVVERKDSIKGG